jgi:NADP-dependent 3-hydroxy acid dehydrogenase YdfG
MARIAIIAGAASGIGQAPASVLVTQGYIVMVDDISGTGTERAAGELAWHGGHDV